jgi:hypothetical protein
VCIKGVQDDAHFKHLVYKKQSVLLARRHTCDNTPHAQVTVQTVEATYLWRASACCHVHHGCCQGRHRGRGGGCRGRGWGSSCILLCGIRTYTAVYTHVCTCVYVCMCVCTYVHACVYFAEACLRKREGVCHFNTHTHTCTRTHMHMHTFPASYTHKYLSNAVLLTHSLKAQLQGLQSGVPLLLLLLL